MKTRWGTWGIRGLKFIKYNAMKNLNKILFAVSGGLLLGGGAVLAYMQARPQPEFSDLTLANIEALAGGEGRYEKGSRCYVFSPNGVLVDKVRNAYPG